MCTHAYVNIAIIMNIVVTAIKTTSGHAVTWVWCMFFPDLTASTLVVVV